MPTHVILLCCTGGITARLCSLLRFLAGDLDSHRTSASGGLRLVGCKACFVQFVQPQGSGATHA